MSTINSNIPPLNTAETLVRVPMSASSQSNSGGANTSGMDSTQLNETENINNNNSSNSTQNSNNNTISAAADSSDNQPGTPQPNITNINDTTQNSSAAHHHPYSNHHIYANSQSNANANANTNTTTPSNLMYSQQIYSQSNMDLQQPQLQPPITPTQNSSYPSYINSYEQFYQQQQQQQQQQQNPGGQPQHPAQMDFINSNLLFSSAADYKQQAALRFHPYLHAPASGLPSENTNSNANLEANSQTAPVVSSATSSVMSPRVVSSTSPSSSSNQMPISGSASSIGSMSAGNPSSPNGTGTPQCKKCGAITSNETELHEHITSHHGASPYGSSGYASSPYIKEELQQQTPPSQSQQQQKTALQQSGNSGEILDLDSQKMLYPPTSGSLPNMLHPNMGSTDPLHGLHNMQQRAGMSTWDQAAQEGLPAYLPQQQNPTESKNAYYNKPSTYHLSNNATVLKPDFQPIVKSEYKADAQQYIENKSFDGTNPNEQQQMMPPAVSSSPSEFPSTTTEGPQDNAQQNAADNQQFCSGNFEHPSSSSSNVAAAPIGAKAANWKSNEARRPKTYNCTACAKWFTSSGHLKRHYNTTLHKNAVKSSGQPDPCTLPISNYHHPTRDPTGRTGRRGAAAAAAANAANSNALQQQQQQLPPNPVQPPEPPNSPQEYGGPQVAASGLPALPHFNATPSPNSMYQQQQYQTQQYMPHVQSSTNVSPQHSSTMDNRHVQLQNSQQQTTVNGHPNALAGPSVKSTQQQAPMPSSQMRGLLNTTVPLSMASAFHITKIDHMEAATTDGQQPLYDEVADLAYLTPVKQEFMAEMYSLKDNMVSVQEAQEESKAEQQYQHLQEMEVESHATVALMEVDHNASHHHNTTLFSTLFQLQHYQMAQPQQADMEHLLHNTTISNMQDHSPLIISQQQYQEQQQHQHQMPAQDTYILTQTPPPPPPQQQQQHPNTMERQSYINIPSAINMPPPPSNMLQPLPPATTIPTTNMVSMLPLSHHHMQPPQQQLTELQPPVSMQQLDTINTSIQSPTTTTSSITNMQSYHQLQHPASALQPADPTLISHHTIIGNTDVFTLDTPNTLVSATDQQVIQTPDGRFLQILSPCSAAATSLATRKPYSSQIIQGSPEHGDLPCENASTIPTTEATTLYTLQPYSLPMTPGPESGDLHYQQVPTTSLYTKQPFSSPLSPESTRQGASPYQQVHTITTTTSSPNSQSPTQHNMDVSEMEYKSAATQEYIQKQFNMNFMEEQQELQQQHEVQQQQQQRNKIKKPKVVKPRAKRSSKLKKPPTKTQSDDKSTNDQEKTFEILPDGRIQCLHCPRNFARVCYHTQHLNSNHSGTYPHHCERCGKKFRIEVVYLEHLRRHKSTDKPHKCSHCTKQFQHKIDWVRHIEIKHELYLKHKCHICEKGFCRRDHLYKHIETHNRNRTRKNGASGKGRRNKKVQPNQNQNQFDRLAGNPVDPFSPVIAATAALSIANPVASSENGNRNKRAKTAKSASVSNIPINNVEPHPSPFNMFVENQVDPFAPLIAATASLSLENPYFLSPTISYETDLNMPSTSAYLRQELANASAANQNQNQPYTPVNTQDRARTKKPAAPAKAKRNKRAEIIQNDLASNGAINNVEQNQNQLNMFVGNQADPFNPVIAVTAALSLDNPAAPANGKRSKRTKVVKKGKVSKVASSSVEQNPNPFNIFEGSQLPPFSQSTISIENVYFLAHEPTDPNMPSTSACLRQELANTAAANEYRNNQMEANGEFFVQLQQQNQQQTKKE